MKRFSIGIVGAGVATQNMHLPVLSNMKNVDLVWLTDADFNRGMQVANSYGIPYIELPDSPSELPDCDVVLLSIPLVPRVPYYEQLAERGIAVLAEKPFAINSQDHMKFQQLFEPYKIGCGYQRRLFSTNVLLQKIVKEEWFGVLNKITINVGGRTTKTGVDDSYQDLSIKDGGGILINLGCHLIDLGFFICGAKSFLVNNSEVEFDGDTDRKAQGSIMLLDLHGDKDKKCLFEYCVSWLDDQSNTIELEFDNLTLVGPFSPGNEVDVRVKNQVCSSAKLKVKDNEGASTTNQAFYLEWKEFLQGLEDKCPSAMATSTTELTAKLIDDLLADKLKRMSE